MNMLSPMRCVPRLRAGLLLFAALPLSASLIAQQHVTYRPAAVPHPSGFPQAPSPAARTVYTSPTGYSQPVRSLAGQQNGYAQPQVGPVQPNAYTQPRTQPQAGGYAQRNPTAPQNTQNSPQSGTQSRPQFNPQTVPNQGASYNPQQRQRPADRFWQQQTNTANSNATRGEHLQQWMDHHNQMSTQDQQRALSREPGFNQLPQQTQQRMLDRLQRLNSMPQQQRQRVLQRSEQMERLSPDQSRDVRSAMGQLGALPQDRRRVVARSFRELRPLTPEQRTQYMSSPAFQQQFSNEERGTLNHLLTVSPMLPQQ